jgi:hypothetical protein
MAPTTTRMPVKNILTILRKERERRRRRREEEEGKREGRGGGEGEESWNLGLA